MAKTLFAMKIWCLSPCGPTAVPTAIPLPSSLRRCLSRVLSPCREAAAAAYTLMFKPAGCIEPMGVKILPPPQIMHQGHHDRGVCFQNLGR